jgi:hypothetical protein
MKQDARPSAGGRGRPAVAWATGVLLLVALVAVAAHRAEAALAATLLARGFTFWLPMAPGVAIARREIAHGAAGAEPTPETPAP